MNPVRPRIRPPTLKVTSALSYQNVRRQHLQSSEQEQYPNHQGANIQQSTLFSDPDVCLWNKICTGIWFSAARVWGIILAYWPGPLYSVSVLCFGKDEEGIPKSAQLTHS